jgi:hypothetical protein
MPMAVFFHPELTEPLGLIRMMLLQSVGQVGIDSRILLLQGDGQGQDLLLAQAAEGSHIELLSK